MQINKIITSLLTLASLMATAQSTEVNDMTVVFEMGEDGSQFYRIPALAVAADGSLVALADKRGDRMNDLPNIISVVAKRSTDGGRTWSRAVTVARGDSARGLTFGDPALALDRNTGNLVTVYSGDQGFWGSNKEKPAGFYVSQSSDNGLTWTAPRNITAQVYQDPWHGAFAASGRMLQCADGRLMFVANTRLSPRHELKDVYEFVCSSADGGNTWSVLNPDARIPSDGIGNESKLVELPDGSLIMSIRSKGNRRFATSHDGGRTWTADTLVSDLIEPDCNGDIITLKDRRGRTILAQSIPSDPATRQNASVQFSADGGKTWPVKTQLYEGLSAYTSMAQLPDGSLGCLVEVGKWDGNIPGPDGFTIYFKRIEVPEL